MPQTKVLGLKMLDFLDDVCYNGIVGSEMRLQLALYWHNIVRV